MPDPIGRRHAAPRVEPGCCEPIDYFDGWTSVPNAMEYGNAFRAEWELFLRHVVLDAPFRWDLREGAKGVQLAELGYESWAKRAWVDVPDL